MGNRINHEAILASAGSGKTFQLAHRYIRLLAEGVRPDRIIALTFSRKAAGEIFDSIIKYLCEAAASPEGARQTAERIGKPEFAQPDFLRLLRRLLDSLHRLHISTLDSFIIGIIRTFPMELGVSLPLRVLDSDGAEARTARQQVLSRIFNSRSADSVAHSEFLRAFKQATFGREEKGLERILDDFVGQYRDYYQILPSPEAWGHRDVIWPEDSPWLQPVRDVKEVANELANSLEDTKIPDSLRNSLARIIDFSGSYNELASWDDSLDRNVVFSVLLDIGERLGDGEVIIPYRRGEYSLTARQSSLFFKLLCHVIGIEFHKALRQTDGIYRIIDRYEQVYDDLIRQRGRLTFDDAKYLLTEGNKCSRGALISRACGEEARLYIDYRLDCELDHWLLDEFQDTSNLQWEVLRNLVDEILQDDSGRRSFFYVGDAKQAIYGWRGGNAQLSGRILDQYGGQIQQRPLNTSFRSSQPVIDAVNRVFGNLPESDLPAAAIAEWEKIWQIHQCQKDAVPEHGYVALLEPGCHGGDTKPADEDRYRVAANLLKEIDPLNRGLTVGVLVRTNEKGKEIVDFLRRECRNMKIIHEGRAAIADNPVVSVLLSLVKFVAHPSDSLSWRHLEMSPLNEHFARKRLDRDNLPVALLREIDTSGFQTFIRTWGALLERAHPLDDFGRKRLTDLIEAAGEFDSNHSRDCNSFLRFIENYQLQEIAAESSVRVMTIHQSKGLGFDVVILPDLQGRGMSRADYIDLVAACNPGSERPLWALKMPRRVIARSDPTLAAQLQAADAAAAFGELCVLYVALTRARQGLYMITSFPGKNSKKVTPATFIKTQLAGEPRPVDGTRIQVGGEEIVCLYETGERDWYAGLPKRVPTVEFPEPRELPDEFCKQPSHRKRLARILPSMQAEQERNAGLLFEESYRNSLDVGTAIHELFARVSWIGETDIEGLIRQWEEASLVEESVKRRTIEHFRQALVSEEIRRALSRPEGHVELWREKQFEIVLGERWVTGSFDRVIIVRDADGKSSKATIIDFKSDDIASEADLPEIASRYRSQLLLYGRALSRMLRLDASQITLRLLFTYPGRVYDLD